MECPFMYTPGVVQYIIKHVLCNLEAYRNGTHVYVCACGVVEDMCNSESYTGVGIQFASYVSL